VVEQCSPRAFLIENVERFRTAGGLDHVEKHVELLGSRGLNYSLKWAILDAADYGVPQHRRRFVAWGFRDQIAPDFPRPTHGEELEPRVTSWDALAGAHVSPEEILAVRGRWGPLLPSIPEGENYLWHTHRGGGIPLFGWRTRYWSFLKKLRRDAPAPTIVANPSQNSGPFHWHNRLLSISELARIQSFPADYAFVGARPSQQRQIGNAVPPRLAEILGCTIAEELGSAVEDLRVFSVAKTSKPPPPVLVHPVCDEFLHLRGNYADHPGPGKGPKPRPISKMTEAAQ
jgi:DNA (cytosine-5)-methyltransferase 1